MRKLFVLLSYVLFSGCLFGQQFGGTPAGQRWMQINSDTARIIFPSGLDSQANRVASIIHYLAANKPVSAGDQLQKVSVVLQHQTTIANGYAQLGPFRSEFFLTPDPNNFSQGSISWTDQLALHEYRHVQQFNNFNHGLSKLTKVLFGQEGYALAINASIPDWYYEGDAVYQETVATRQGRGRLPLFLNSYPALWQGKKKYSWMKLRNGSLKDYVPSHYPLGYLLVNYGRAKYGENFWRNVTRDASAYKGLFYPFQKAIRRYANIDYQTFRDDAFAYYQKGTERVAITRDEFLIPTNTKFVEDYLFPYQLGGDTLLYLKTSYRERPAFYQRVGNHEEKIRTKDISIDEQFSYRNGRVVYASFEKDPRWGWRDYSVINLLDLQSGRQKQLTAKSKYFTPDISADGKRIAAVQNTNTGKSSLHIIDAANGQLLSAIQSAEINLFTDPKFIDDNSLVTAVRLPDGKMALATADISTGVTTRITPPSFNVVGYPCVNNDIIYFTASYNGNDDIFAIRPGSQKIFQLTDGPLGNYNVNVAAGKITWSVFTADGYQLKQEKEVGMMWKEITSASAEKLITRFLVAGGDTLAGITSQAAMHRKFNASKYSKSSGLFNFHSWRPYYEDPIFTFSLYGENILNTLQTEVYYLYNQNQRTSAVGAAAVYGGFFPNLNAGTEFTFSREEFVDNRLRNWDQLDTRLGVSIPLRFTSGRTFRNFSVSSNYVLRNEFNKGFFKTSLGNTSLSYLQHSISWSQQVQRAVQHIFPRLGYGLSATYRHAITAVEGNQFNANSSIFLPGAGLTHHLVITGNFQQRDTLQQVFFANGFPYSRGYTGRNFSRMWRVSGNYHFPLFYPDFGVGNIVYIQRIRANAFYDFSKIYSRDKKTTRDQRSAGGEIFLETRWWNQYPLTFGFRVSRLLDQDQFNGFKGTVFEFILPISILPK